jgi:hypothetical protein
MRANGHSDTATAYCCCVDLPSLWPAFFSTRSNKGWGLCGAVCCNVAAILNECMGTTRSSSTDMLLLAKRPIKKHVECIIAYDLLSSEGKAVEPCLLVHFEQAK